MISLCWILLGVVLVPLFVASWRLSLAGLTAQGLLLGCLALSSAHVPFDVLDVTRLVDLVVVRGVLAPVLLGVAVRAHRIPSRVDLIPPNFLWWTAVLAASMVAFEFAAVLVPAHGGGRVLAGVATSMVLVAFLILSTQTSAPAHAIAVVHLENAIALVELEEAHAGVTLLVIQTCTFIATIALFRWYLSAGIDRVEDSRDDIEERVP